MYLYFSNILGWSGSQNSQEQQQPSYTTSTEQAAQSYAPHKDMTGYTSSQNVDYSAYMTGIQYPSGNPSTYESYNSYNDYYGGGGSSYGNYYGYVSNPNEQSGSAGYSGSTGTYGQNYEGHQGGKNWSASNGNKNGEQQQKHSVQRDPRLEKRAARGQAAGVGRGRETQHPTGGEGQPPKPAEGSGRGDIDMRPSRAGRGGQGSNRGAYSGSYRGDSFDQGRQYEDPANRPPQMPPMINNNYDDPRLRRGYNGGRGGGYDQIYPYEEDTYKPYQHPDRGWNRNENWHRGWPDGYRETRGGDHGRERGGSRGRGDRSSGPRRGGIDRGEMSIRGRKRDDGENSHPNQSPSHMRGGFIQRGRGRGGPNLTHSESRFDRHYRSLPYSDKSEKETKDNIQCDNKFRKDIKDTKQAEKHKLEIRSQLHEGEPTVKKQCKVEHKVGVKSLASPPPGLVESRTEAFAKEKVDQISVSESQPQTKPETNQESIQHKDDPATLPDSTSKDNISGPSPAKKRRSTDDLPVDPEVEKALEEMMSPLFCKLCNLTINHPSQAQSHYNGKHHAKKVRLYRQSAALEATLAKKAAQGDLITTVNLVTEINPEVEPEVKPKEDDKTISPVRKVLRIFFVRTLLYVNPIADGQI